MSDKFDYRELGLKCGLEIHQQLDSKEKLFCRCPTKIRNIEESDYEFFRYLRPTASEMGETDRAALEQSKLRRRYVYKAYDTTCLVENDDEPPTEVNREALDIALSIAKLLNMVPVDQVHVMRKIVVDGSNTSGFQRTAFIAKDGYLKTSNGPVGVGVLCLEEEACQKIEDKGDSIIYSLDRLGIPLVEIGTDPDIISPAHAKETAQQIGMMLRSTGKVKRGLGTIRQDVNISIAKGARVELKGVQALDMIETIVEREVQRQVNLLAIRDELRNRGASVCDKVFDVSRIFSKTESKVIKKALAKGRVYAILLRGFNGFVGREVQPGRRLGTEFSDRAKTSGVGGIFHTDELPNYGITEDEVRVLYTEVGADADDAIVMVADLEERALGAMESVIVRAIEALGEVPEETRRSLPDGNSSYLRPLPGAARMYPETDVPQVIISTEHFDAVEMPELLTERAKRFESEFDLHRELAEMIVYSVHLPLFEKLMRLFKENNDINATLVVRTLTGTLPELKRDGVQIDMLDDRHFIDVFGLLAEGGIAKEAVDGLLRAMVQEPELSAREVAEKIGLGTLDMSEVERIVESIVDERRDFIREKGLASVGPLMGVAMAEVRGKVDGKTLNEILKQKINKYIDT
ncbi:MAG: Glu-tRNA(Gln) amidotransferase subunit GatE [Methanolobus sp.]|nr:Glu-tRNA(Gln) amidotransferase subunit GatE [Methanolobus sp.]